MQNSTSSKSAVLLDILNAIADAVAVAGSAGAPAGVLYAALMSGGCSLAQFEQLMGILVSAGRVTRRGDLYFSVAR